MSFSPPFLLFLTVPLSSLSFIIFFHFYTKKSKFSPHAKWNIIIIINNGFRLWQIHCYKNKMQRSPVEEHRRPVEEHNSLQALMYVKKHNVLRLVPQETDVLPGGQVPNNTA